MAKNLQFVMLLDCYGEFLTQRQRQATELYYGEDLSLGEIAELAGTSRQAVRDSIKRSEEILLDMEEKLQFAKRLHALRMNYAEIAAMTENIAEKTTENPAAQQTCRAVLEKVQEGLHLL
ncbi:MAG: YlxM family DNA-binding protein [Ruminococcus sp.]